MKIFKNIILFIFLIQFNTFAQDSDLQKYQNKLDLLYKSNPDSLLIESKYINRLAEDSKDYSLLALSEMYIGLYYGKTGIYDKALNNYFNAEDNFNKSGNKDLLGRLYGSIGSVYRHLKDYNKSIFYFSKSYSLTDNKSHKEKSRILNRIGDIHRDLNNIDSSFYYYFASLKIVDLTDSSNIANNLNNLADLHRIKKQYDSSEYYYFKSLDYLSTSNDNGEIAENYSSIALLYLELNQPLKSIENITKSINVFGADSGSYELYNSYNTAISIYRKLNIKDSLINYLEKILVLEKKSSLEKLQKGISAFELEQDLKNKDIELHSLKRESDFKQRINYLLIVIIFLAALTGFLLWRQINLKKIENKILVEQKDQINKAKDNLEIAYNNINELNATKDKFFSIIAHDLRNPLGSFKEVTRLLNDAYDDFTEQERKEFLEILKSSSENIYSLLENLLEWSMSQKGAIQFNPVKFELNDIVIPTINVLKLSAENKSIQIENNIKNDTIITADPNLMTTVLRNIISNAIKFTSPNGTVKISSITDNNYINISITDTGIGMSPKIIEKLFRIDVNINSLGTSNEKGTGLGLILCKEFIEKHNGKISVESEIGKGSTFLIQIPII
jgi:signal transduction histidine kinase